MSVSRVSVHGCALIVLNVALAGCGGGGGDAAAPASSVQMPTTVRSEAATPNSDINAGNFGVFVGPLARAVLSATGDSLVGNTLGGSATPAAATSAAARTRLGLSPIGGTYSGEFPGERRMTPAAFGSQTQTCPLSGTLTVVAFDADNNSVLGPGDSVTLTASNCVLALGGPASNGGFTLTINAIDLDNKQNATALDAAGSFARFSIGSVSTLNGSFRFWSKQDSSASRRQRLSYQGVASSFGTEAVAYNFDISVSTGPSGAAYAMDGAVSVLGQAYKLVQQSPFSLTSNGDPGAGSIMLKDVAGDTLQLSAKAGGLVDFLFFPSGSAVPSATLLDQSWSTYRSPQ
jgi:hypothetical protein